MQIVIEVTGYTEGTLIEEIKERIAEKFYRELSRHFEESMRALILAEARKRVGELTQKFLEETVMPNGGTFQEFILSILTRNKERWHGHPGPGMNHFEQKISYLVDQEVRTVFDQFIKPYADKYKQVLAEKLVELTTSSVKL